MKKLIISIIIAGMLIFGMSMGVMADTTTDTTTVSIDVDAIATLDIIDVTPASFTITVPTAGAIPIVSGANESTFLAYTSVVASGATNKIQVSIPTVLLGLDLYIQSHVVSGTPHSGTNVTSFDLNTTVSSAVDLVTGIGSGYTGASGDKITYTLSIDDINAVVADDSTSNDRVVTFTIIATTP